MTKILGLSSSLRNARFGAGSRKLTEEICNLGSRSDLKAYLRDQTKIRMDDFIAAGRGDGKPFSEIYRTLSKAKGDRGLSNSEACLVAGLWGARQCGVEIEHCGLASFFPMPGTAQDLDRLREIILGVDALLLAGPVYFGDRSSVAQEFIEFLREDPAVAAHIRDRVYAGISVGAKRNGGQETTLIYQLVDMTNLNMLAVGNDSETTSQYGGTAHAGDIGTAWQDDYGLDTAIGTGRRIARIARLLERGRNTKLANDVNISVWVLQDTADRRGRGYFEKLSREIESNVDGIKIHIHDFTDTDVARCIACDICPTDPGRRDDYRCIINKSADAFKTTHTTLINADAILTAAYSPVGRENIHSVYQRFIERTRYLRRDDYVIGDRLVAPLVISEIDSNQNLHIRMLTSLVRHHTVLHHPIIGMEYHDEVLNWDSMLRQGSSFARNAKNLTAGRLAMAPEDVVSVEYNPVGYEISAEKRRQDIENGKTETSKLDRSTEHAAEKRRLVHKKEKNGAGV